jgi:uncharacterized membrane protein
MGSNYTEQETERVRQAERSSAGLPTQQLSDMPVPPSPSAGAGHSVGNPPSMVPAGAAGRNNIAALALIAVGVMMLLGRVAPLRLEITGGMVLLTIASCFLFFSFWKRIYGLMIPGCILAGLSVGVTFADLTNGVSVLWGLALGFFSIFFLGRALFHQRSAWPTIPAVILFGVGLIVAAATLPGFFVGGLVWLPLLLIGAGLFLGWGRRGA